MKVKFSLGSFSYKGEKVIHTHIMRTTESDTFEKVTVPVDVQVENIEIDVEYSAQELSALSGMILDLAKMIRKMDRDDEKAYQLRQQEKESTK